MLVWMRVHLQELPVLEASWMACAQHMVQTRLQRLFASSTLGLQAVALQAAGITKTTILMVSVPIMTSISWQDDFAEYSTRRMLRLLSMLTQTSHQEQCGASSNWLLHLAIWCVSRRNKTATEAVLPAR